MRTIRALSILALLPATLLIGIEPPHGFRALFNGQDLEGWYGDNPHQSLKADDRAEAIKEQQEAFKTHWKRISTCRANTENFRQIFFAQSAYYGV